MQTYSIVFLDIDGTLLNSHHHVPPKTKRLLNELEGRGVPIVLCSARYLRGVELIAKEAELHSPIICQGGSLILSKNRMALRDIKIETSFVIEFSRYVKEHFSNIAICVDLYNEWFTNDLHHPLVRRNARILQQEPKYGDLEALISSIPGVHKVLCVGEASQIMQLQKEIAPMFHEMDFLCSGDGYLEVMKKGVSKCEGVKLLQEYYQLQRENVVACGDQFVDIEMIQYAGLGIAMGNAPMEVKAAADIVTTSNDEEGIYMVLRGLHFQPPKAKV